MKCKCFLSDSLVLTVSHLVCQHGVELFLLGDDPEGLLKPVVPNASLTRLSFLTALNVCGCDFNVFLLNFLPLGMDCNIWNLALYPPV